MRDADVRYLLKERLNIGYGADAIIIEELGLCHGNVRADLVLIQNKLKGYEIKSKRDTLIRLPHQVKIYSKVFDTATIVASEQYLEKVAAMVPAWWGIDIAKINASSTLQLSTIRNEEENPSVDPLALVELLWRDELLMLLTQLSTAKSLANKPRHVLGQCLVASLSLCELKQIVRDCLKRRKHWRVDAERIRDGERFLLYAMSSGSLYPPVHGRSRRYTYRPS